MNWLTSAPHARWLEGETDRLLGFGRRSMVPSGGFARQTDAGEAQDGPAELWITCRMTHVYALGELLGRPGCAGLVDHGITALREVFADREHGGWFAEVRGPGEPADATKAAYPHAFVVLAASSATVAGRPGAAELLADALAVQQRAVLGRGRRHGRRGVGSRVRHARRLSRGQRQHAHGRGIPERGRRHRRPRLAGPGGAHRRAGGPPGGRRRTTGASPSTTTRPGTRCWTTTPTCRTIRSGRSAPRRGIRWNGPG